MVLIGCGRDGFAGRRVRPKPITRDFSWKSPAFLDKLLDGDWRRAGRRDSMEMEMKTNSSVA
jgi:hypothetical protein